MTDECWCIAWWGPPPRDCIMCKLNDERPVDGGRGTSNGNSRGSSYDRRRRKQWLLDTYGDGTVAPCYRCEVELTFDTITVDRIVPACRGGTYVRSNIRPACGPCNSFTGGAERRDSVDYGLGASRARADSDRPGRTRPTSFASPLTRPPSRN